MFLTFYGALGHSLFAHNDPYHFGTYALGFLTCFQMSTFENWSTVFFINYHGCDSYTSEYTGVSYNSSVLVDTFAGEFVLPFCANPIDKPFESTFFFISFVFIEGVFAVESCLAAVRS